MITRDVDASDVADLAFTPPRAALVAITDDGILLLPVNVALEEPADPASSARIVQVPEGCYDLADRNVVIVVDDGPQWFRLRALAVRGAAQAVGNCKYRVVPKRITAWDYGSLREIAPPPETRTPQPAPHLVATVEDSVHRLQSPNFTAAVRQSRVMILASRSVKGIPFAVPLWFVPHRGRFYATTSASSWTVRNVAALPQVAMLLGGERRDDPDRLLVRGVARVVRGMPPPTVIGRITWHYYLAPRFAAVELSHIRLWARRMRYYSQSEPTYIVITPQSATEFRVP